MTNEEPRIIKKYPNRRLYDTEESRYITLSEVRGLVTAGIPFKVVDTQSGEEITRSILLQVIIEQENEQEPLFTTESLLNFIRHYGAESQQGFSRYLDQSLRFFQEQQEAIQAQMAGPGEINPVRFWTEMEKKNLELWKEMQENLFTGTGLTSKRPGKKDRK